MEKLNCWEFMKCGREPLGTRVHEQGVCPAAREWRVDGAHGGRNAGRICWLVSGTMCEGEVTGTFALKHDGCEKCDFYKKVKEEEAENFISTETLRAKLRSVR